MTIRALPIFTKGCSKGKSGDGDSKGRGYNQNSQKGNFQNYQKGQFSAKGKGKSQSFDGKPICHNCGKPARYARIAGLLFVKCKAVEKPVKLLPLPMREPFQKPTANVQSGSPSMSASRARRAQYTQPVPFDLRSDDD